MGMDEVVIGTKSFQNGLSAKTMSHLLACLCSIDVDYLLASPNTPLLYASNVRYREEPFGEEKWNDVPTVIARGTGDCEDLACWRAAELITRGVQAKPIFLLREIGQIRLYHIVVQYPDGLIEDPSYKLGMRPAFNLQSPFQWRG